MSGIVLCVLLAVAANQAATPKTDTIPRHEVRVGIVAFEDFHSSFEHYRKFCEELSRKDPLLHCRLATGTYGDVLHWIEHGQIDVAFMPPGVFVETLADETKPQPRYPCSFLAGVGMPPARSPWSGEDRRHDGYHTWYRSVCVVPAASSLKTVDELRSAASTGDVEFLFVHPLSVAGYVAPLHALSQHGIQPRRDQIRFTYSHSESLRLAAQKLSGPTRVAFVWDDAAQAESAPVVSLRVLPVPELASLEIPQDVVVTRTGFEDADRVKQLLLAHVDSAGRHDLAAPENAVERYRALSGWIRSAAGTTLTEDSQLVSMNEIGQMLLQFTRTQPSPPRLAVVLSGGGAKCAYQVGAIAALEEKLSELRASNSVDGLDIAMVVGTSGGAINAVPIALGVTASPEGRRDFHNTWAELDQRDIVRPSWIVRLNIGLWFAVLCIFAVAWCVRRFFHEPESRRRMLGWTLLALGFIELIFGLGPWRPWRWLGENHFWHHAWLWLTFGVHTSAWTLIVVAVCILYIGKKNQTREQPIAVPRRITRWALPVALLGLPLAQIVTVLWFEDTLSGGQGMEAALAEKFPSLIDKQLARSGQTPLSIDSTVSAANQLESMSQQLIDRGSFRRDLVITGSCLEQTSQKLPSDLYFYAMPHADASGSSAARAQDAVRTADQNGSLSARRPAPPFGARGIALTEHPQILMDVVMGSGSIFPVFPARKVKDFPARAESIWLVDGGFAHNSPIEAAVLWGATHIVLIEASPKIRITRDNFFQNAVASFDHLYEQAQLLDAHSRGQVLMFTLAPEPPHICVLDFADNLIEQAIATGYHDARLTEADSRLPFRKELGQPSFVEIVVSKE